MTKPRDEEFDWDSTATCCMGQFYNRSNAGYTRYADMFIASVGGNGREGVQLYKWICAGGTDAIRANRMARNSFSTSMMVKFGDVLDRACEWQARAK